MEAGRLLEPGDQVTLVVVRAERVQPNEVYWGAEAQRGQPRRGFVLESEGVPVPRGAVPLTPGLVQVAGRVLERDDLVLVQAPRV